MSKCFLAAVRNKSPPTAAPAHQPGLNACAGRPPATAAVLHQPASAWAARLRVRRAVARTLLRRALQRIGRSSIHAAGRQRGAAL